MGQGSRGAPGAGEKEDAGTRGRGELRDTQISARRSQGLEGTSNPVSLSPRHPLSVSPRQERSDFTSSD
jgi:hypothetical protein